MSFWNFLNFAQTSKINSKLSEPGTTLEDLLADDSIITEFKSLNPKLLDLYFPSFLSSFLLTPFQLHRPQS